MMQKDLIMMRPVLIAIFLAVLHTLSALPAYSNVPYTITKGTRDFVYNQNQQLIRVSDNGVTKGEYTYDGKGRRVKKVVDGVTTIFHYDQNGQLITESDGAGNITTEYVYLNGQPFAKIEGANTYYYHNDHLGTPQKMTDGTGAAVWVADYKPFGEATVTVSTITNNLRGIGQYFDQETGLIYNHFRYLNPQTGRFIQADPLGLQAGYNPYDYVENNPLTFIDPWGLSTLVLNQGGGTLLVYPGNVNTEGPPQSFPAGNRTTNPQGNPYTQNSYAPLPTGIFPVGNYIPTGNDPNSAFGTGFFPITLPPAPLLPPGVAGPPSPPRTGPGIHSGRANRGGPRARTQGCVRTTDPAIQTLRNDPPTTITVQP